MVKKLADNPHLEEFGANKRLQWMVLVVLLMLMFYVFGALNSRVSELKKSVKQQAFYLERLKSSAQVNVSDDEIVQLSEKLSQKLATLPKINSKSLAEVVALNDFEKVIEGLIKNKSLTILGSEDLNGGQYVSISLEIRGFIERPKFIELLTQLQNQDKNFAIGGLVYEPKRSSRFTILVKALYLNES